MSSEKKNNILIDYTIKGQALSTVDKYTYLRVEKLPDISWNKQVESVVVKANKNFSFVQTVTTFSPQDKMIVYKTLVCPQMEYGTCIIDPYTQLLINKLESVCNKNASTVWQETLEVRRSKIRLSIFYKIPNNLLSALNHLFCAVWAVQGWHE